MFPRPVPATVRGHHDHPYTTQNQKGAEEWINYLRPVPTTPRLIAATQYVPVLSDMTDALNKVDPETAKKPVDQPARRRPGQVEGLRAPLTDEQQTQEFNNGVAPSPGADPRMATSPGEMT